MIIWTWFLTTQKSSVVYTLVANYTHAEAQTLIADALINKYVYYITQSYIGYFVIIILPKETNKQTNKKSNSLTKLTSQRTLHPNSKTHFFSNIFSLYLWKPLFHISPYIVPSFHKILHLQKLNFLIYYLHKIILVK